MSFQYRVLEVLQSMTCRLVSTPANSRSTHQHVPPMTTQHKCLDVIESACSCENLGNAIQ